jgi:hypothetical protein
VTAIVTMSCNRCHAQVQAPTVREAIAWSDEHNKHCPAQPEPQQETP